MVKSMQILGILFGSRALKRGKWMGTEPLILPLWNGSIKPWIPFIASAIYRLLDQVELGAKPEHVQAWNDIMTEMFGDSETLKRDCYQAGRDDPRVGKNAKKWLEQMLKS